MYGFHGKDRMYYLAASLLSDSGENAEYDRAITELVMLDEGLGSDNKEDIAAALRAYADPALSAERKRLEGLRVLVRAQYISYGELHELQGLAEHIDPGDVELLEAAGVPEHR